MLVRVATFTPYGSEIAIILVDSANTAPQAGAAMLRQVERHIRVKPIMLLSIEENGYRAYATFQTAVLLALLQLEQVTFADLDLTAAIPDLALPF